ncbi:MAG: hypothetical protein GEU75_07615 [Dehalococcoidia bacterium]|nr:hypothetical protein [Dehalococcoidia bacterium]
MSRERIDEMLQECLAAYEHGLTPEECLSAFPEQRAVLEPLFRQALSLRFAFANSPRQEYRQRTRERLLFAAGRDVSHAYSSQPDELFVERARRRLVANAGAGAQEALRNVPPPRLPFWVNARRRLLEAAAMPRPRAAFPMALALRGSLSAAVVVLAIAVAGLAYLTSQTRPQGVSAEVAQLEVQWQEVQDQLASGRPVQTDVIVELTTKASTLATRLSAEPAQAAQAPVAEKLSAIIDSQQDVVNESPAPELVQAQQQLNQAEEKVRILASRVESPTSQPSAAASTTPEPTNTPAATATARPGPTATPAPVLTGQVRMRLLPGDTTYGLSWTEVRTSNMSFVIPATWEVTNVVVNSSGIATLDSSWLSIEGDGVAVLANTRNGEIQSLIEGERIELRTEGKNGEVIDLEELVQVADEAALPLRHMLASLELTGTLGN